MENKITKRLGEFDKQINEREDFIKTDKGTDRYREEMIKEIETLTRNKFYVRKGVNLAIDEVLEIINNRIIELESNRGFDEDLVKVVKYELNNRLKQKIEGLKQ